MAIDACENQVRQDEDIISFFKILTGLVATSVYLPILLFVVYLFPKYGTCGTLPLISPNIAILIACLTCGFIVFRKKGAYFATYKGELFLKVIALIGTVLAPVILLHKYTWPLMLALIGLGVAAVCFLWFLCLTKYSRIVIEMLLFMAVVICGVVFCALILLDVSLYPALCVGCASMLICCAVLFSEKGLTSTGNMLISSEASRERAITANTDRWTFATIGLNMGFTLGLIYCLHLAEIIQGADGYNTTCFVAVVLVAIALSIIFVLFSGTNLSCSLRNMSKDYLAFTVTLGAVPILFLSPIEQLVCCGVLLTVSITQVLIAISASIEFVRFEELSPAWYMGEDAFISGGIAVGLLLAWLCSLEPSDSLILPVCVLLVVLFNVFAQTFIVKGAYPTLAFFQEGLEDASVGAQTPDVVPSKEEFDDIWKKKITHLGETYLLSPRQTEILELLAKGRSAKYIGEYFCISLSTVKSHIATIYSKLDIHSRQALLTIVEETDVPTDKTPLDLTDERHTHNRSNRVV